MNSISRAANSHNLLLIKTFFLITIPIYVAGCVTPSPPAPGELEFRVTGRLSVVNDAKAFSASFVWHQYPSKFELEMWGPFGQGRTRIAGGDELFTVVLPTGERVEDVNADDLMVRELGWSVPLGALPSWIRGRPADSWPASEVTAGSFDQLSWHIELERWREISGQRVPGRLVATRSTSKIVLVFREWTFGSGTG